MNLNMANLKTMNKTWRIVGLVTMAAGILYYPALRLFRFIAQKRKAGMEEDHKTKSFTPSYRGQHKPHRRKAEANGQMKEAGGTA